MIRKSNKYKKGRRPDWGTTPTEMANKMASGQFLREQKERKSRAKRGRLFNTLRRIDRQFDGESKVFYDKLAFKIFMKDNGILTPKTYAVVDRKKRLPEFWNSIRDIEEVVIKPNRMSEGRGIRVLKKTDDPEIWTEMDGSLISIETIQKEIIGHLNRMTNNRRVRGDRNKVYAEERIHVHDSLKGFTTYDGIVDFRVYVMTDEDFNRKEVLYAKVRCPNKASKGMGNTAKGATALFVNSDGIIEETKIFNNVTTKYKKQDYSGTMIPMWNKVKEKAEEVANLFDSPFHSVDMTINQLGEVVVVEAEKIPLLRYFGDDEADRITEHIKQFTREVFNWE